jgi:hypothetical protein
VTAHDGAGNTATDTLTVTYSAPTNPISLTVSWAWVSGQYRARLVWSIVSGKNVNIYRNGSNLGKTANDGGTVDTPPGAGPYSYYLCVTGTSVCSNTATLAPRGN